MLTTMPELHDDRVLRYVNIGDDYRLLLWDTYLVDHYGKCVLGYALWNNAIEQPLFEGEDFCASPLHAIDSDSTLRVLLSFLTLQPGDVEAEYFKGYTPEQMMFARSNDAEQLGFWADDDSELEFVELPRNDGKKE